MIARRYLFPIIFAILFIASLPLSFAKNTLEFEYHFEKPVLGNFYNYTTVQIPDTDAYVAPGEPVLPMKTIQILIPADTEVKNIEVKGKNEVLLGSYNIEPGQQPVALCCNDNIPFTLPNKAIYNSNKPFPEKINKDIGIQKLRGYEILVVNLFPVKYIPSSGELSYYREITVTLSLEPIKKQEKMFRNLKKDKLTVQKKVDNPLEAEIYDTLDQAFATTSFVDPAESYDYVIITNQALKNAAGAYTLQDLADFKNSKGTTTTIVTVEEILAEPDYHCNGAFGDGCFSKFNDTAAHIRNFIKDAYHNWETEYVLLAGDGDGADVGYESGDNIIPARGFNAYGEDNIPADMYYSNLDGNFDYNKNSIFGETRDGESNGEVDLYAELYIGRAPVDSAQEVSNFVRKTIAYETSGGSYLEKAWMVGEHLGFGGPSEYAGDSKDEIKYGSNAHGYTTVGFSEEFNVSTLYDRDYPTHDWPKEELISIINGNIHIINHLGHASTCYVMKMCNSPYQGGGPCLVDGQRYGIATDVDDLTNDEFVFGYTQGCYPGSFDNWNYENYYTTCDSIAEHFVASDNAAFAFIANSRYGWGRRYSTDGPSQRFDRQFWDAVFGENITSIGKANQDSKEDNIGSIGDSVIRYCYYEITLFGDPETSFRMKKIDLTITTDKNAYDPGETILVSGTVRNETGPIVASLTLSFLDPAGAQLAQKNTTSPGGSYSSSFVVPQNAAPGMYSIEVKAKHGEMSASKTRNVKVGSLIIDLAETQTVIPYNTTHSVKGYVYYSGGGAVTNANVTAYIKKDAVLIETLSGTADSNGHFSMNWLPSDHGNYQIEVYAKDPSTLKIGKADLALYVNPPAPGTLRINLLDHQGKYIYEQSCPYIQSEQWYDLNIEVYDEEGKRVIYEYSAKCEQGFNLTHGAYKVVISGRSTFYQYNYVLLEKTVSIPTGGVIDVDLTSLGKLNTILKDPEGFYIYDKYSMGCPYSGDAWDDIITNIYNQSGGKLVYTYNTACIEGYYLMPGNYLVEILAKHTYSEPSYTTLLKQQIEISSGEIENVSLRLGKVKITLKDAQGNYIHDAYSGCPFNSTPWYDIAAYFSYLNGSPAITNLNAGCVGSYYVIPGAFKIQINGRMNLYQSNLPLYEKVLTIAEGRTYNISTVDMALFSLKLKDVDGNYLYSRYTGCEYSPSKEWYELNIYIYNRTNSLIASSGYLGCKTTFALPNGTYAIYVNGKKNLYQNALPLYKRIINVTEGKVYDTGTKDMGLFRLSLKDTDGNYLYSRYTGCENGPSKEWYELFLAIYYGNGSLIANTGFADCSPTFALPNGTYAIYVNGRKNLYQNALPLYKRIINVTEGTVYDTGTKDMGLFSLSLKDVDGNYLYSRYTGCDHSPSKEWYELYLSIYYANGSSIATTGFADCKPIFALPNGTYAIYVNGKKNLYQNALPLYKRIINVTEGIVYDTGTKDMGLFSLSLKDVDGNYIYSKYTGCDYSPKKEWDWLYLSISYANGSSIATTGYADCNPIFGLPNGTYSIYVNAKKNLYQNALPLYKRIINVTEGRVYDTGTKDMALFGLIVVDKNGNHLYSRYTTCELPLLKEWYDLSVYLYNATGSLIQSTSYIDCKTTFGLPAGTYNVTVRGRETSLTNMIAASNRGPYEEGKICIIIANIEDNIFTIDCYKTIEEMFINLKKGWNLISIPLILENNSVNNVFKLVNYSYLFSYDSKWKVPTKINNTLGYWIKVSNNGTLTVEGLEPENPLINLNNGWNLIGHPYLTEKNVKDLYANNVVYAYNNSWSSYIPNRTFNSLQTLKPGYGYWVLK